MATRTNPIFLVKSSEILQEDIDIPRPFLRTLMKAAELAARLTSLYSIVRR